MKNQTRTIMGALDYSIATLQGIRTTLMDISHPKKELNWAVGGIIATLTSQLLRICNNTFVETGNNGEADAKQDIKSIQVKLNAVIDEMIGHE